jgi:iron(III) transport system ATP-binding protein
MALVGESGSGKTTLTRLISGLDHIDNGCITLNGKIVSSDHIFVEPEDRSVGLVFQDYALFPHLTVFENVAYGLLKAENKKNRVEEVLELVGLNSFQKRYPHQLSGGQQQRIALARALAPKPKLIILDEPFSNLDASNKDKLSFEIEQIIRNTGVTAIYVTHDTQNAMLVSDKMIVINKGRIAQLGTPKELYTSPQSLKVASLFTPTITLTQEDLSYFNFKTNHKAIYAIRVMHFEVNDTLKHQCSIKVSSSKFYLNKFVNVGYLPNQKKN